jgi:hypothetical protein
MNCPYCHRPPIEIDHYGERLIGCIRCNRWTWPGTEKPFMALHSAPLKRHWCAMSKE